MSVEKYICINLNANFLTHNVTCWDMSSEKFPFSPSFATCKTILDI